MAVNYSALVGPMIEAFKEFYQKWRDKSDAQERSLAMMNEKKADRSELEELRKENQDLRAWICTKDPSAIFCNVRAK